MSFKKIVVATLFAGVATVGTACSNDAEEGATAKRDSAAACEHLNRVCAGTQGFQKHDCSTSNAEYGKLSDAAKSQVDAIIPCVMSAKSCEPALQCVRPAPSSSGGASSDGASSSQKARPRGEHDTQDACEHINKVCAKEEGFRHQDCSTSNADYEELTDEEKEIADGIVPCIMKAQSCKTAFDCLDLN